MFFFLEEKEPKRILPRNTVSRIKATDSITESGIWIRLKSKLSSKKTAWKEVRPMEVIYRYDGSFEGFLCCVFDSYVNKEFPAEFQDEAHLVQSLFPDQAGWEPTCATPSGSS